MVVAEEFEGVGADGGGDEGQHDQVELAPSASKVGSLRVDQTSLLDLHPGLQGESSEDEPVCDVSEGSKTRGRVLILLWGFQKTFILEDKM